MIDIIEKVFLNFSAIGSILGVLATIYFIEGLLIPLNVRSKISKKIEPLKKGKLKLGHVVSSSFNFFEKWFGKKHLSLRCFFMSAFSTLIFTVLGFLLIAILFSKYDFDNMTSIVLYEDNYKFIMLALMANIFIDYLSLAETRFVINRIKSETSKFGVFVFLIADALMTFLIFIVFFSLFKSLLDFLLILPDYHSSQDIIINHGADVSIHINSKAGYLNNFLHYWLSVIKYSLVSSWKLMENGFSEYWFSSLFLPTSNNSYTIHTSTIWLTTHFSSFYIYLVLLLWVLVRLPLNNLKIPWVTTYSINQSEYPLTVIAINIFLVLVLLLLLGYIHKYVGWSGLLVSLIIVYFTYKKISYSSEKNTRVAQTP